jgi:hypothetical protein
MRWMIWFGGALIGGIVVALRRETASCYPHTG